MNRNMKKILALVLSVVMLVSVLGISALAENRNVKQFNNYLILGDSVASGYGLLAGDDYYGYIRPQGLMIQGMYGTLVAQETGANVVNFSRSGLRTGDMIRLLDKNYQYDAFSDTSIGFMGGTSLEDFTRLQDQVAGEIQKADLITLNVGSNDCFTQGMMYASNVVDDNKLNIGGTTGYEVRMQLVNLLTGSTEGDLANAVSTFFMYCYMAGLMPAALTAFAYGFVKGMQDFSANWDRIIEIIRGLNPNATLVALGLYNPFLHEKLTNISLVEIGAITNGPTIITNNYIESGSPYSDQYIYCDVTGVADYVFAPSGLLDVSWITSLILNVHPTLEGHRYIADCIEQCLGGLEPGTSPKSYTDHPISISNTTGNGTAVTNVSTGKVGEDTAISVSPNEGYHCSYIYATDGYGNPITVKRAIGSTYVFRMPDSSVNINVGFEPGAGEPQLSQGSGGSNQPIGWEQGCPSAVYSDMTPDSWYHTSVDYVLNRHIMAGTSANTFEPNSNLTRAMVCTILYAMEGKPAVLTSAGFSDVQAGQWFADPVNWAASNNIVAGMGDGTFGPDNNVTREQLATMLRSYAAAKGKDVTPHGDLSGYSDTGSVSFWATENVAWAVGAGLIAGRDGNMLAPQGTATRAEAATMIHKFCTNVIG